MATKKPARKNKVVIRELDEVTKVVQETKVLTNEDKILGVKEETVEKIEVEYNNPTIRYRVTNLEVENTPTIVTGDVVDMFIGSKNREARNELKAGAKKVITKNFYGKDLYKIEVIK